MKIKHIKIYIIFFVMLVISFLLVKTYLYKASTESNISEEKLDELVNINELSEQFMNNYFNEVGKLTIEDKKNLLIVVSENDITNNYGASKVISSPNNMYYLIYNSQEELNNAFKKLKKDSSILSVSENITLETEEFTDYNIGTENLNSWALKRLGYEDAKEQIEAMIDSETEKGRINEVIATVIDTGLYIDEFKKYYGDKYAGFLDIPGTTQGITDPKGHGTHVAGTVAQTTPSNVKIFVVKVGSDDGKNYTSDVIDGMHKIVSLKQSGEVDTKVINFSMGNYKSKYGSYLTPMEVATKAIVDSGIIFVASSGNNNIEELHVPSGLDNVISVSAVDSNLEKAYFSSYGEVEFASAGYNIYSLLPDETKRMKSGTSMSSPHVAGAVAILKSFNPDLTFEQVVNLLKRDAIDIGDNGLDKYYGYGVVNFKNVEFCNSKVVCDDYGVFKKENYDSTKTIKIESPTTYVPKYNYGSITNILDLKINLYYSQKDYYTKTLGQLYEFIKISGYDPYLYTEQKVVIKYKDFETTTIIDNTQMVDGWGYDIKTDGTIRLVEFKHDVEVGTNKSYYFTDVPQVVYIPNNFNDLLVTELGDNLFKDKFIKTRNPFKRFYISDGIISIGKETFAFSENDVTNNAVRTGPLMVYFPSSINSIDSTIFNNRENIILLVKENSEAKNFAVQNNIEYYYLKTINANLTKLDYKSFERINSSDVSLEVQYAGSGEINETITNFNIRYNNDLESFRYGDSYFTLEFDTSLGEHVEHKVDVTVNKADPNFEIPNNLKGRDGQLLSEIILPEYFEWINGDTKLKLDVKSYKAKYVPEDLNNYNIIENIDIPIEVEPKTVITPSISVKDKTYDGTTKVDKDDVLISNLNKPDYSISNIELLNTDVGEAKVKIKIKLSDDKFKLYSFENGVQEKEFEVKMNIIPKKINKPILVEKEYVYNGEEQTVQLEYFDTNYMNITGNKRIDVGKQEVKISLKNQNFIWSDGSNDDVLLEFVIKKAPLNIKYSSSGKTIKYDGKEYGIELNIQSENNVIVKYADSNGNYTLDNMPKYKNLGDYVIKYKISINNNYDDIYGEEKLSIIKNTIVNKTKDYETIFDSKEHGFSLDLNLRDYNVKYSTDNKNYNLESIPKYKEVGEHKVYYKVNSYGYNELSGSNKIKIYGIKSFDKSLELKDNVLIVKDFNIDFENISNKIDVYAKNKIIAHYDNNNKLLNNKLTKTGDKINININGEKDYKYSIAILGDVSGDGKINYMDYVGVYNHIYKNNHPESNKKLLTNEYLYAANIYNADNKINYLDYVKIYNTIKKLNGGNN